MVAERALASAARGVVHHARPFRRRVGDARAAGAAGARDVGGGARKGERPPGGLPDSDRQPRGRDAARALGPARGGRGGLRGHAPHAGPARPLRRQGRLVSYHEHNEQVRASELVARMREAPWWLSYRTPGCRSCPTPATCWCAAVWRPGCRWRCCPGPRPRSPRWWPPGCPPTSGASTGFLPRKKGELRGCSPSPAGRSWPSSRRAGCRRTLALLAELDPGREVAVCRELTKVHEEIVRGSAAELAARYADAPPRGEVVLVLGPAIARPSKRQRTGRARCAAPARRRGRPPAPGGRGGGRADRRERERALPRAHDGRSRRPTSDGSRDELARDGNSRPALRSRNAAVRSLACDLSSLTSSHCLLVALWSTRRLRRRPGCWPLPAS